MNKIFALLMCCLPLCGFAYDSDSIQQRQMNALLAENNGRMSL